METMTGNCPLPEVYRGGWSLSDDPPVGAHVPAQLSLHGGVINPAVASEIKQENWFKVAASKKFGGWRDLNSHSLWQFMAT